MLGKSVIRTVRGEGYVLEEPSHGTDAAGWGEAEAGTLAERRAAHA